MTRASTLACLAFLAAPAVFAQEAGPVPLVFERLEGSWTGSGSLFDRPAAFRMEWRLDWEGRVAALRFDNAFLAEDGRRTPVLEAAAYYLTASNGGGRGMWIDSRGEILALRYTADGTALTVHWEGSERGRTAYRLVEKDLLEVRDYVRAGEEWRSFGQATYRRTPP